MAPKITFPVNDTVAATIAPSGGEVNQTFRAAGSAPFLTSDPSEGKMTAYQHGPRDHPSVRLLGGMGLISIRSVLIVPDVLLSIAGTGRLAIGLRASKKTSHPSRRRLWFM